VRNLLSLSYFFTSLRKPAKKGVWSEEEVEQLRALYEEYKNSEEEGNILVHGKISRANCCQRTGVPCIYFGMFCSTSQ